MKIKIKTELTLQLLRPNELKITAQDLIEEFSHINFIEQF